MNSDWKITRNCTFHRIINSCSLSFNKCANYSEKFVLTYFFTRRMGLFGNKSFNKKKATVRKSVSLNNLSTNPTVRAADLHPDPENVRLS